MEPKTFLFYRPTHCIGHSRNYCKNLGYSKMLADKNFVKKSQTFISFNHMPYIERCSDLRNNHSDPRNKGVGVGCRLQKIIPMKYSKKSRVDQNVHDNGGFHMPSNHTLS